MPPLSVTAIEKDVDEFFDLSFGQNDTFRSYADPVLRLWAIIKPANAINEQWIVRRAIHQLPPTTEGIRLHIESESSLQSVQRSSQNVNYLIRQTQRFNPQLANTGSDTLLPADRLAEKSKGAENRGSASSVVAAAGRGRPVRMRSSPGRNPYRTSYRI